MDPKLSNLLRVAADAASSPQWDARLEKERGAFLFDVLPRLLQLESRLREPPEGSSGPREVTHAGLLRERARLASLAKESTTLRGSVDALAFALGKAHGLVPLLDALVSSQASRLENAREEFSRRAEETRFAATEDDSREGVRAGASGRSRSSAGGGKAETGEPPSAPPGVKPEKAVKIAQAAKEGKSKPTVMETLRKREEKKRKREERRELFGAFDSLREGATAAGAAEGAVDQESYAVVDEALLQAARFREGSLPWAAKLIGVPVTADRERARRQYRQRARQFHPDVCEHPRAHEAFALLQRAWDVFEPHACGEPGPVP